MEKEKEKETRRGRMRNMCFVPHLSPWISQVTFARMHVLVSSIDRMYMYVYTYVPAK